MVRAHAAREALGRLEPFEYDPGQLGPEHVEIDVGVSQVQRGLRPPRAGKARYRLVLDNS